MNAQEEHELMNADRAALAEWFEEHVTREDALAWHTGAGMTEHLESLVDYQHRANKLGFDYIEVWGMPDPLPGEEPLSVKIR